MSRADLLARQAENAFQADMEAARKLLYDVESLLTPWVGSPLLANGVASGTARASDKALQLAGELEQLHRLAHKHFRNEGDPKITSIVGRQAG